MYVDCKTQREMEKALKAGSIPQLRGSGHFEITEGYVEAFDSVTVHASDSATVHASGSATVRAYDSATVHASDSATVHAYDSATVHAYDSATVHAYDSATVHAYGSATVHAYGSATVHAYGSATVHAYGSATVRAYDSATVHASDSATVRAYGSATVHAYGSATVHASDSATVHAYGSATVHAYGSATVRAYGSATVHASKYVGVTIHSNRAKVEGGQQIKLPRLDTPEKWCEFYGVTVSDGIATLFKAVDEKFMSPRGMSYMPGTTPEAPDWDGGQMECGGGLHFSPRPYMAMEFNRDAVNFVACPVALSDIAVHPDGAYPQKVKARRVCAPCWQCDLDGKRIETKEAVKAA